jgi:transcriptional regulator with XRE-family HTH domain
MKSDKTIFDHSRDNDTLGGRIGRARESAALDAKQAAVQLGVSIETWDNWENDRDEPRANRLAMLAGFLNVSPSWLLFGMGEPPSSNSVSEVSRQLEERLAAIERSHRETGRMITLMRDTLSRLARHEEEG